MSQVTGAPTKFADYPAGWRAMQLPDSNVNSYFLKAFGRPDRDHHLRVRAERRAERGAGAAHLQRHVAEPEAASQRRTASRAMLAENTPDDKSSKSCIWRPCRAIRPTKRRAKILPELAAANGADKRQAVEDLYWSVLSSNEFLFNH